jgi:hypothetical protein
VGGKCRGNVPDRSRRFQKAPLKPGRVNWHNEDLFREECAFIVGYDASIMMLKTMKIPSVAYVFLVLAPVDFFLFTSSMALVDLVCAGVLMQSITRVSAASIIAVQVFMLAVAFFARDISSDPSGNIKLFTCLVAIKVIAGIVAFVKSREA